MAFTNRGLFYAQLCASLEYAIDQGVEFEDFHSLIDRPDGSKLEVEVVFSRIPFSKAVGEIHVIKFSTIYETIHFRWDRSSELISCVHRVMPEPGDPECSQTDLLKVLVESFVSSILQDSECVI